MRSYKITPILRTVATDQIELIQSCWAEDAVVALFYLNKIIADLNSIKSHIERDSSK